MARPDIESLLRGVLDAVPARIVAVSADGTILAANQSWKQFASASGLDPEHVSEGVNYFAACERVTGPDAQQARTAIADIKMAIANQTESGRIEYACHSPTGERWFTYEVTPLRVAGISGAVVVHRDVTVDRQARVREHEIEASFRDLFENALDASLLVDLQGRIVRMNAQAERLFGWPRADLVGQPVEVLIPRRLTEGHPALRTGYANRPVRRPMGRVGAQFWAVSRDGREIPVDIGLSPVNLPEGQMTAVSVRDLTERHAAEQKLIDSERSLAMAQATAHLGDWRLRTDGTTAWSDEMFRLHYFEDAATGSMPSDVPALDRRIEQVHPEDRERVLELRRGLIERRLDHVVLMYRTNPAAGPVRTLEMQARTVTDDAGNVVEWHGTVLDVTERERKSAELRQHQKMQSVGRLAGGIAHDFNNILAEIIGFAGFVRNALEEADPRRADILCVLDAADRAAALTRQLLAFSRQQPADKRPTDLNQQLDKFSTLLRRTIGEHIEISIEPSAQPAVVLIDPAQFDQVMLNLVSNARDAMQEGGTLRLSINVDAVNAYMRVTDTGIGMDAETRHRIFDPFFTTKPLGHGSGMGLATCFGIVEDAGGSIRVESAVGSGSTFLVTFPLSSVDLADAAPAAASHQSGSRKELLLCEDEPGLRRVGVRALEEAGYRVHVAADGHEAIRRIDELGGRLAAIVSDLVMPGCGGEDVATHAASVVPHVPVLLTSGYFDHSLKVKARAAEILWKPVPPMDLIRAVGAAISKAEGKS